MSSNRVHTSAEEDRLAFYGIAENYATIKSTEFASSIEATASFNPNEAFVEARKKKSPSDVAVQACMAALESRASFHSSEVLVESLSGGTESVTESKFGVLGGGFRVENGDGFGDSQVFGKHLGGSESEGDGGCSALMMVIDANSEGSSPKEQKSVIISLQEIIAAVTKVSSNAINAVLLHPKRKSWTVDNWTIRQYVEFLIAVAIPNVLSDFHGTEGEGMSEPLKSSPLAGDDGGGGVGPTSGTGADFSSLSDIETVAKISTSATPVLDAPSSNSSSLSVSGSAVEIALTPSF